MIDNKTISKRRNELNGKYFPSEKWFHTLLKDRNMTYGMRRNSPILGKFFGDFVYKHIRVVIEIDGSSHDGKAEYDNYRDSLLKANGWNVYRIKFPNTDGSVFSFLDYFKRKYNLREKVTKPNKKGIFKAKQLKKEIRKETRFSKQLDDLRARKIAFEKQLEMRNKAKYVKKTI